MKKENVFAVFIIAAIAAVTGFIIWLVRKNNHKIGSGELQNEDILGIMETWDSKSDEVIKSLHPKIRQRATDFVNDLNAQGIKYRLYSGRRTFEEQAELYGKGRTSTELAMSGIDTKYAKPTEAKVTNAKPGSSFHNYALAFDGVEIKDGIAIWNNPNKQKIADTGKKYGFFWGGDFTTIKDEPHFEDQQFGTISQLLVLYNSNQKDSQGYLIV